MLTHALTLLTTHITRMLSTRLQAVHWLIDELKAVVPIWKKEFFADGSTWKENPEGRRLLAGQQQIVPPMQPVVHH
jgi:molybdopterin synthase catalytic subunit